MTKLSQRCTIYFDPGIRKTLSMKAAEEKRSMSEIVNEAVAVLALEDAEDTAELDTRLAEQSIGYADFIKSLKGNGIK